MAKRQLTWNPSALPEEAALFFWLLATVMRSPILCSLALTQFRIQFKKFMVISKPCLVYEEVTRKFFISFAWSMYQKPFWTLTGWGIESIFSYWALHLSAFLLVLWSIIVTKMIFMGRPKPWCCYEELFWERISFFTILSSRFYLFRDCNVFCWRTVTEVFFPKWMCACDSVMHHGDLISMRFWITTSSKLKTGELSLLEVVIGKRVSLLIPFSP